MTTNNNSPILISLEGNIGSGKSTILEKLSDRLSNSDDHKGWIFLKEPVHIWNTFCDEHGETMLSKFYQDPKKYSFAFQIMAFTTRLNELKRILRENPNCTGIICERSLEADKRIFAKMLSDDGLMEPVMYQIYQHYFTEYDDERFRLNGIIYVDADAETCFQRIIQRSRDGESGISLDYLQKCRTYHEEWLNADNSLHLNTNSVATFDLNDQTDPGTQWLDKILYYLQSFCN